MPDLYMAKLPSPEASMQTSRFCGKCEQLQTVAPASVSMSHAAKPASQKRQVSQPVSAPRYARDWQPAWQHGMQD